MRKLVSDFKSPEKYQKNYIREGLMQFVGQTDGRPMLLHGFIHRNNQGNSKRGYCTNVKIYFPGHHNSEIYMLTNHLMILGLPHDIKFYFVNHPPTQQRSFNRATIYMLGYPILYETDDVCRCGFRLAYDCMEQPFKIEKDEEFLRKARSFAYIPDPAPFIKPPKIGKQKNT